MTPQLRKLGKGMPVIIALLYFLHLELVFSLLPLSMMGMILIGCTIAFLLYTRLFPHYGSSILALFLLLFFLWTIVALPSLWHILYNATLDTYRANSTLTFYPFSVSWDPQRQLLLLSGLLIGLFLFLSALFDCLLRICRWPRAAAFLLVVLLIPCVLHHVPQPFTILPLIALLFGLFFANRSFQRPFRLYTLFSAFLVLMLILSTLLFPREVVWEQNARMRDFSFSQMMTRLQQLFTGNGEDHIDLSEATDRFYVGSIHLSLYARPQTYYLRTYSGALYQDNQWTLLPAQRYDSLDTDYRSILLQLPAYDERLLRYRDDTPAQHDSIDIEDFRGSDQRVVPYYLSIIPDEPQAVYDSYLRKDDDDAWYAYRLWEADVYSGYVREDYTLPDTLDGYAGFVMNNYTQISEEQRQLFSDLQLTNPAYFRQQGASMQETTAYVRSYLEEHASYTLSPGDLPSGEDFLTYFLTDSHRGYCVHYATAATLMMRYYGYPARYVEGYRITAGDFTDDHAYVRDHHAHAWVEVYDEVLGWIPLEFTESAPAQETAPGEESDAPTLNDPSSDVPDIQPAEDPSLPDPQPQQPSDPSASAISIGWLIAIAVFLFAGLTQLLRHHRKMRRCHRADANAGVHACWQLLQRMQTVGSTPDPQAERIALQARFSKDGVTREQQEQMLKLLQQAQKDLRSLPVIRRIRLFLSDAIW